MRCVNTGKPEAFAREAMLFETLLTQRQPRLASTLRAAGVVPEAYAQKYLCGMCVHVLPFEHLCVFIEKFLQQGWRYLVKFALALVDTLEPRLMGVAAGDSSAFLSLLRLDPAIFSDQGEILCSTSTIVHRHFSLILFRARSVACRACRQGALCVDP